MNLLGGKKVKLCKILGALVVTVSWDPGMQECSPSYSTADAIGRTASRDRNWADAPRPDATHDVAVRSVEQNAAGASVDRYFCPPEITTYKHRNGYKIFIYEIFD